MSSIPNPLINSVDFSGLPAELKETVSRNPMLFNTILIDGFEKIRTDFNVIECDEKTPLVSLEIQDILQPAKDEFDPTEGAVQFKARLPEFHDIDIDLSLRRSDILGFFRSYLKYVEGLKTQAEVLANPWPLFFLSKILEKAGHDLALTSAYRAIRNNSKKGALFVMNGLVYKLAQGRATGGDIKTGNVFNSTRTAADFDTNAYDEVNQIGKLTEQYPELVGRPMTIEMSLTTYNSYKESRRKKSEMLIALDDQPKTLDNYPHIKIKVEPGLGVSRFIWLTLDGNKFFTFNENYKNFNAKMIESIKGYEVNIMFSADVNYGYGKYVFSNNRVD
ncbi:hypothetical protein [Siphonobacter sp. SORGH_AS_1065]|uniref:hypothetical protein n=1 Tax=Siphonobacter sp. SORGH_AS_1065 TaxID=3041795 RepID=UPI002783D011|nr:hypothetical protein [Siphonobacter sp. SORGH_AS_1065]MDQ1085638.1 hypothetical protein [Siphonobacter sp. SORGH_AS_1065]